MLVQDHLKKRGLVRMGENKWGVLGGWCHCGLRKIVPCQPRAQPPPHSNDQGLVRPSFYQPLVPVSIRRRSAAQVGADAHTDSVTPGDGRIDRVDVGFRSGYRFSQVFQG
jgi:hypothetical protein